MDAANGEIDTIDSEEEWPSDLSPVGGETGLKRRADVVNKSPSSSGTLGSGPGGSLEIAWLRRRDSFSTRNYCGNRYAGGKPHCER